MVVVINIVVVVELTNIVPHSLHSWWLNHPHILLRVLAIDKLWMEWWRNVILVI